LKILTEECWLTTEVGKDADKQVAEAWSGLGRLQGCGAACSTETRLLAEDETREYWHSSIYFASSTFVAIEAASSYHERPSKLTDGVA
jgi:hypothetical protein